MNNYPYNNYPYGGYQPPYQPYDETAIRRDKEKKRLRRVSGFIGLGVIFFVCFQLLFSLFFSFSDSFVELYENSLTFQLSVESLLAIVMIGCPYLIIRGFLNREKRHFIPLSTGDNKRYSVMFIFIGLAACIGGGMLTGITNEILEDIFHVTFTQQEYDLPTNTTDTMLYLLRSALIPALVEELAMRGGVLQAMRKYGDWFAIITSSFVFAILHGNMIQIPFAFVAGIALGYTFIVTGSMWPCIAIHFVNNLAASLVTVYGSTGVDEFGTTEVLFVIYEAAVSIIGIICLILYIFDKQKPRLLKGKTVLTTGQKAKAFILNVPMIISILYMAYITAQYIE